jgi:hypothetical protein
MVRNRKRLGVRFQLWLVLFVLLIANVHDSVAWGPQGHRVVGFISESHLQPDIKKLILEKFNINSLADVTTWTDEIRKKIPSTTPILQKASGLMMLQGTAQVVFVSPNKFENFQIFWLTLPYLYSKEKTHLNIWRTLSGTCINPCI